MGACALIPPLWRRVIDQRLLDYYDGDITRVNRGHVGILILSPIASPRFVRVLDLSVSSTGK